MITAKRKPGWNGRLSEFLMSLKDRPLAWGSNDCSVGLISGAVYALTETDIAADWVGAYGSAKEAMQLLKSRGFETVEDVIATMFERRESTAFAAVGDIAVLKGTLTGVALGIFERDTIAVMTEIGIDRVERNRAIRAYAVG